MYITLLALVYLSSAKIDNALPKLRFQRYPYTFRNINNEDSTFGANKSAIDELVVHPSNSFTSRSHNYRSIIRRREVSRLSPEFLDDKAADAVFTSQRRVGPPAPPTAKQYEHILSTVNISKASIEKSKIVSGHPEVQGGSGTFIARKPHVLPPSTFVIPFDSNINPEFPAAAPRARGLIDAPEGFNINREVDIEFQTGYKWRGKAQSERSSQLKEVDLRRPDLRSTFVKPTWL